MALLLPATTSYRYPRSLPCPLQSPNRPSNSYLVQHSKPSQRHRLIVHASVDHYAPSDFHRNRSRTLLQFAAPIVFFFVGLGAAAACSEAPKASTVTPASTLTSDRMESEGGDVDEELEREFEAWKKKKFAWTVPLRVVALRGSFPASWFKDFLRSQSRRLKLQPEFCGSLQAIHQQLVLAFKDALIKPKSVVAADMVTIGDTWLSHAICTGIIEPIDGADNEQWFNDLSHPWKVFLRRNKNGLADPNGSIWGAPYRWGTVVIAYKKDKFKKNHMASIEDWGDLWRPELSGKISMIASPREVIGLVLKYLGASYNTRDMDSEITGGRNAVMENLALLQRQVRLFDSTYYLKAFTAGEVWVAVGWSSDVIPIAKRMSNVAVIIPKSGSSFWADIWAVPAASKFDTDQIGGRVRGPSPLIHQWIDFCLQPARAFAFQQEVIPGATPSALELPASANIPNDKLSSNRRGPSMDTNMVSGVPPLEILARCEFLEPLSEKAYADYGWLVENMQKGPSRKFSLSLLNKLIAIVGGVMRQSPIRSNTK